MPGDAVGTEYEQMVVMGGGYGAGVVGYTVFGIPWGEVVFRCGGGRPKWDPYLGQGKAHVYSDENYVVLPMLPLPPASILPTVVKDGTGRRTRWKKRSPDAER